MLRFYKVAVLAILMSLWGVQAFPDSRNPNAEYELINPKNPQGYNKTVFVPITTPRSVTALKTPPPPQDSKSFVYDPVAKTWTQLKKDDPPPAEDALIWNQNNDKWLTMAARV